MPKFGKESQTKLSECHADIQKVLNEAIKYYDFTITCGHRNELEQNEAFSKGLSKLQYPLSEHNKTPSMAVDCAPYPIDWNNKERFAFMAGIIIMIAQQMNIKIEWGGNWEKFKDYPHFQIKK